MRRSLKLVPLLLALTVAPATSQAQSESPISVHAALNVAGGRSNDLPILGIPSWATYDYRTAMVQFRYAISEGDAFVVQLLNRRLGTSPLQAALPDVAMQWGYWQRRSDWGTVKVGRAPMPRGIFNEIRFVGTVLPFFRPSFEIYGEGRETVDGVVYSRNFEIGNGVDVKFNAFGGSNEVRTQVVTAGGNSIRAFRGNSLKGTQVWVGLPWGETRFGGFFADYRIDTDASRGTRQEILYSAETKLIPRTVVRGEALRVYGTGPNQDRKSYSGEAVYTLTERLDLAAQTSVTNNRVFQTAPYVNVDVVATRDVAFGTTYRLSHGALVRFERHEVRGYAFDRVVPFITNNAGVTTIAPQSYGAYWLASFAISF